MTSSSINPKETRKFGVIAVLFFGSLVAISVWRHKDVMIYIFGVFYILGFSLLILPKQLHFIHRGWMAVGHLIGKTINLIFMTIAYFVVITPAGLLKRVISGRPLPLKPDKNCSSYWVDREEPVQPKERFSKRF